MVDVACFFVIICIINVGICIVVCIVWIIGFLCVCMIGPVYDGLMFCVCGCIIWVTWRSRLLLLLGLV